MTVLSSEAASVYTSCIFSILYCLLAISPIPPTSFSPLQRPQRVPGGAFLLHWGLPGRHVGPRGRRLQGKTHANHYSRWMLSILVFVFVPPSSFFPVPPQAVSCAAKAIERIWLPSPSLGEAAATFQGVFVDSGECGGGYKDFFP